MGDAFYADRKKIPPGIDYLYKEHRRERAGKKGKGAKNLRLKLTK